jgi:hypothetical protein
MQLLPCFFLSWPRSSLTLARIVFLKLLPGHAISLLKALKWDHIFLRAWILKADSLVSTLTLPLLAE